MKRDTPSLEIATLGTWRGARLLAEYDPQGDTIRVDATAVSLVRATLGDEHAERFVACAIAHEQYHRAHPRATEVQAHAFAREACGVDPRYYEAALRHAMTRAR